MLPAPSATFQEAKTLNDLQNLGNRLDGPSVNLEAAEVKGSTGGGGKRFTALFLGGLLSEICHESPDGPSHPYLCPGEKLGRTYTDEKKQGTGKNGRIKTHYKRDFPPYKSHIYPYIGN